MGGIDPTRHYQDKRRALGLATMTFLNVVGLMFVGGGLTLGMISAALLFDDFARWISGN